MVNFIIVVDPDKSQRTSFIGRVKKLLPPVDGLTTHSFSDENFSAAWASGAWTPVSHTANGEGTAIIWGDAIAGSGHERLSADQLLTLWKGLPNKLPNALDGVHVAVVYRPKGSLFVGADLLGIFPLYYYINEDVALIGSSPELFRYYPCFEMRLDPEGLVGILLIKGIFGGKTLIHGVRRLNPGRILTWRSGELAKEIVQYKIPVSKKYFDTSLSEQLNVLDQKLDQAVARHVPRGSRYCLLLSGGIDSRLMGGYLKERGVDVVALSEGIRTDNDVKMAIPVAKALDFEHRLMTMDSGDYLRFASLSARWQHLASGFDGVHLWGFWQHLRKIARRVVSGFVFDGVMGAGVDIAYSRDTHSVSFERLFCGLNSWAFRPDVLEKMFKRKSFVNLVSETVHAIRKEYESYSDIEFQRAYCFGMQHRMRFHVGGAVWLLSLGAWPVLPTVDSKVLEVTASMPFSSLLNRHAEKELLRNKFPELAKLAIAGVTYDSTPLIATTPQKLKQYFYGDNWIWRLRAVGPLRNILLGLAKERRYWWRVFDFNSEGWRLFRHFAQPYVKETYDLFNKDVIEKLLPDPNAHISSGRRINEIASLKSLLGFSLWWHNHHCINASSAA